MERNSIIFWIIFRRQKKQEEMGSYVRPPNTQQINFINRISTHIKLFKNSYSAKTLDEKLNIYYPGLSLALVHKHVKFSVGK